MQEVDSGLQAFLEEAGELLSDLEDSILALEEKPDDKDVVARVFRDLHTIKSCGEMFGFTRVSLFTHKIEDAFDLVRSGLLRVTEDFLTLTLKARDELLRIVEEKDFIGDLNPAQQDILNDLDRVIQEQEGADREAGLEAPPETASVPDEPGESIESETGQELSAESGKAVLWIMYCPARELDEATLSWLTGEMGNLGDFVQVPGMVKTDAGCRYDFLLCSEKGQDAVEDVFLMAPDSENASCHVLGRECVSVAEMEPLADCIEGKRDIAPGQLAQALKMIFVHVLEDARARKAAAEKEQSSVAPERCDASPSGTATTIRVDAGKLDKLINMVGELVIVQSRLSQACHVRKDGVLSQISEDLERLTDTMREDALNIRMMPIGASFGSFNRMVRDMSRNLGKRVELVAKGAETELDKTIIDKLKDPIIHVLRNCMDHGMESPEERLDAGKPEQGTIILSAGHESGDVVLSVTDDGRGIDLDQVRKKAVEAGFAASADELPGAHAYSALFEPGFSTAEEVSRISGRGVGLDVVKKTVDGLRGRVEITSAPGQGTTVSMRLPLTLSILDGFMVKVGDESFILPLSSVQACQERMLTGEAKELDVIEHMGKLIPCLSLRLMLDVPGEQPDYERIVVAGVDGDYIGLAVDLVVGRQQAVIKSLSEACEATDWISGTTVNADGGISLILDVQQIVRHATEQKESLQ